MGKVFVFAILLAFGANASACGGGSVTNGAASTRIGTAGVSVELPPKWDATPPADGNVVDPVTRVVVSSGTIAPKQVPCQIARHSPSPMNVTLVIVEWKPTDEASPPLRPERFSPATVTLHEPPAIECFDGRGGSVQFVDHGRAFGAYLLVGNRASQRLVDKLLDVLNTLKVESPPPATRLARNGVSLAVPADWDGRILFRDAAGSFGVSFQVANFELPANEGLEPPTDLPRGQEDPIKAMDAGDVLITVTSDQVTGEKAPKTVSLGRLQFARAGTQRVPRGHTLAEGSFCYGKRCVRIAVDFGGRVDPALRAQVNNVLASLEVDRTG
jgi:hypothetical protein